jgi:hypothetical protein
VARALVDDHIPHRVAMEVDEAGGGDLHPFTMRRKFLLNSFYGIF